MIKRVIILCLLALPVSAVEPDEVLSDPKLEERARSISQNVRCVVCQNEPIDSSNAGVARELRLLIRERLVAGDTDDQVLDVLVASYGDYVLFKPPFKPATYALWFAPFVIFGIGLIAVFTAFRRPHVTPKPTLSDDERTRLNDILEDPK